MARQLSGATGRQIDYVNLPDDAAMEGLLGVGMPRWLATNPITLFQILRDKTDPTITDDVRELTDREPRRLKDFLQGNKAVFRVVEG